MKKKIAALIDKLINIEVDNLVKAYEEGEQYVPKVIGIDKKQRPIIAAGAGFKTIEDQVKNLFMMYIAGLVLLLIKHAT